MAKTFRYLLYALLIAGLALAGYFYFRNKSAAPANRPVRTARKAAPVAVQGYVVDSLTLWETLLRNGMLLAEEQASLSFETSGKLVELHIPEGKLVRKGQVLARLNSEVLEAELATYQAKLPLARKKLARQKVLVEQEAASQESLEVLETELRSLEASISLVEARLRQTVLTAPFDGYVGLRNVSPGAYVNTATEVVTLAKTQPLKLSFTVPDKYLSAMRQVREVSFVTDNHAEPQTATVYAVNTSLDQNNTLTVRARLDNPQGLYVPGEFASVRVVLNQQHGALAVPSHALTATPQGSTVFLIQGGKAHLRHVSTGIRTDSILQITSGLRLGDTVATTGLLQLQEGMQTRVATFYK